MLRKTGSVQPFIGFSKPVKGFFMLPPDEPIVFQFAAQMSQEPES